MDRVRLEGHDGPPTPNCVVHFAVCPTSALRRMREQKKNTLGFRAAGVTITLKILGRTLSEFCELRENIVGL